MINSYCDYDKNDSEGNEIQVEGNFDESTQKYLITMPKESETNF